MNTDRLQNDHGTVAHPLARISTRRRTAGRNAGASLVEVLIVLVVILIGIFSIIQIFPIGFTSLKKSEARLRADRLTRTATESLTADSSSLPESITFSYYASGVRTTITDQDPDDLGTYGGPLNKLYFSDLNKYRYISNEPIRVPLATASGGSGFGGGVGSVHLLAFGPIYVNGDVGDPTKAPDYSSQSSIDLYDSFLRVTSEPLSGYSFESENGDQIKARDAARRLTGANSYLIDYGDDQSGAFILFAPSGKVRTFVVEYSVEGVDTATDSQITVPQRQVIVVPANEPPLWKQITPVAPNANTTVENTIIGGTEAVKREFTRLPSTVAWDPTEPYQFKLLSANVSTNANFGVIAFNPAGANFSVPIPGGTKPFTALASYAVLDWHILKDDREVPPGNDGAGKVRTTLPSIRLKGDDFVDFTATGADRNQIYPGLYPRIPIYRQPADLDSDDISPDIQVFNLSRQDDPATAAIETAGTPLIPGDLARKGTLLAPGPDANADFWINRAGRGGTYPSGTIYINTERVTPGSKVRILYKAQGDWAVAFQKAAKFYRNEEIATPGGQRPAGNKAEVFAVDRRGSATDFSDDLLYFHRSELNKGVTAAFEIDTTAGTTRLPARQFTITTPENEYSFVQASAAVPELSRARLNGDLITGWRVVGTVNGASLKTRVIWQDEQNGRNPWRISDLETFVTRQGQ